MEVRNKPGVTDEQDIDFWATEGKIKARLHESRIVPNPYRLPRKHNTHNQQELKVPTAASLNRLRERTREERINCSSLGNRIDFMEEELRRKQRLIVQAKGRYQRVLEVRSRSVAEKKELAQQRRSQMKQHQESVSLRASRIRLQRKNSNLTHSLWRSKNQQQAGEIKQFRSQNQQLITRQQREETEKKRRQVERSHQHTEASREKLMALAQRKKEEGRKQHNGKVFDEFIKAEMQHRKKGKLMAIFKEKAKQFEEENLSRSRQLQQYQRLLGKCFRLSKSKSKDSFYLTR